MSSGPLREVAGAAVAALVAFVIGVNVGGHHSGEVLVPAEEGAPGDLPAWACNELVDQRLDDWIERERRQQESMYGRPRRDEPVAHVYFGPDLEVCG